MPENANRMENSGLNPEPLDVSLSRFIVEEHSPCPDLSPISTSSSSVECNSSATDMKDLECATVFRPSGVAMEKKLKLKEELGTHNINITSVSLPLGETDTKSENGRHDMNSIQNLNADTEDRKKIRAEKVGTSEVQELPQSTYDGYHGEGASGYLATMLIDQEDVNETALTDVQLTVNASSRAENVPFVSLTSKLNGISILGYPIEIGEIRDASETLVPTKESGDCKYFDAEGSKVCQLVWRTSKRTPVCYVTNSLSPVLRDSKGGKLSKNAANLSPLSREDSVLMEERSIEKFLKISSQFKQGKAAPRTTCVPVEHIFRNILAAVHGM